MSEARFAVCLDAEELDDLVARKVYIVIDDAQAARDGLLRIVDESGEDYLYPAPRFEVLDLSPEAIRRLDAAIAAA